jgi:opacity protein-like surface antigen
MRKIIGFVLLFSLSCAAVAQERPYYFRADFGVSAPTKVNMANSPNLAGLSLLWQEGGNGSPPKRFQLDAGPMISAAVGWRVAPGWRIEGALAYRKHDMNEASRVTGNSFPEYHYAKTSTRSAMLNGYRDFDLGWALRPYLGAGLGFARNEWKSHITERLSGAAFSSRSLLPHTSTGSAWNLAAGFQWKTSVVTWDFGYRYSDLGKIASDGLIPIVGGGTSPTGIRLTGHMRAHEFTVGLLF